MLCIGYFYRVRKEKKENLKAALYILLEIWHRMAILYRNDFNAYIDALADELAKRVPEEGFTEEQRNATKQYLTPILRDTAHSSAFSDVEHYQQSFDEAVKLLAVDDPFFAYEIGSAGNTKKLLKALDRYLETVFKPLEAEGGDSLILSKTLKEHLTSHAALEVLSDLESDIYKLAFKIGFIPYIKSLKTVRKRKKRLKEFSQKELKELVETVLFPAMEEFNKQRQVTL